MTMPPSRSYRHGLRGRHKHATSPETKKWAEIYAGTAWLDTVPSDVVATTSGNGHVDGHVDGRVDPPQAASVAATTSNHDPGAPSMPSWLTADAYEALLKLKEGAAGVTERLRAERFDEERDLVAAGSLVGDLQGAFDAADREQDRVGDVQRLALGCEVVVDSEFGFVAFLVGGHEPVSQHGRESTA